MCVSKRHAEIRKERHQALFTVTAGFPVGPHPLLYLGRQHVLALDAEEHGKRTRHIDGGVGTERHTDHHGHGKAVDQRTALEQQRQHHDKGEAGGDDGTTQGLCHGEIENVVGIPFTHLAEVLRRRSNTTMVSFRE